MRGYPKLNFPLFDEARDAAIKMGFEVISPADIDREFDLTDDMLPATEEEAKTWIHTVDQREIAKRDLLAVLECGGIVLLPYWHNSKGAVTEAALADWLNLQTFFYNPRTRKIENIENPFL